MTIDDLPYFVCKSSKGSDETLHLSRLTYLIGTISLAFILCIDLVYDCDTDIGHSLNNPGACYLILAKEFLAIRRAISLNEMFVLFC